MDLKEALVKAIQAEIEGHNFYTMASRSTDDPKGKEIFNMLALEETEHAGFLKSQYKAVLETGTTDAKIKLGQRNILPEHSPIFSDGLKSRAATAHQEMTALSIGIQLELNAINFYREQAKISNDKTAKEFFDELTEWESGHYNALLRQYDSMKEDYWNAAGFAPF
jgi:rubrerythrin